MYVCMYVLLYVGIVSFQITIFNVSHCDAIGITFAWTGFSIMGPPSP
jgi:hypothetical protein